MSSLLVAWLAALSLVGGIARGASAIGSAVLFIGGASWFTAAPPIVPLASALDVVVGGAACWILGSLPRVRDLAVDVVPMGVGSLVGALVYQQARADWLQTTIGLVLVGSGVVILLSPRRKSEERDPPPQAPGGPFAFATALACAGFLGGLTGLAGPALAALLLLVSPREDPRPRIVVALFAGALVRLAIYVQGRSLTQEHVPLLALLVPLGLLGLLIGCRVAHKLGLRFVTQSIGVLILVSGVNSIAQQL